jgi:hypothetical protein
VALSASALQIYAGYPSLFYFTALMAGVYSLAELFFAEKKLRAAAGLLAIYPVALALAAAQLLPALAHMPESVRTGGVDAAYASTSSLRWENLPLLVSPYLYGGRVWLEEGAGALRWWGNEHPYSCTPFVGLGALLLAAGGLRAGAWRRNLIWPVMAALALAIAMGPRTPVFGWLRGLLPGFSGMRLMGLMLVFFALAVAVLAGGGVDTLLRKMTKTPRWLSLAATAAGLALLVSGLWVRAGGGTYVFISWARHVLNAPGYAHPDTTAWWARAAANGGAELMLAGGWWLAFGALLFFPAKRNWPGWTLAVLTVIELFYFVRPLMRGFRAEWLEYPEIRNFFAAHPSDERHLNLVNKDSAPLFGRESIWGFEELALRRYADLLAVSQGLPPEQARSVEVRQNSRLFQLLRARYAFVPTLEGIRVMELQTADAVLPRFSVVGGWRVMTDRDVILRTLAEPDFDFRREVILEIVPDLPPALAAGTVPASALEYKINVLSSSATRWEIEVGTNAPGVLLMTDAYAKGWRAQARPGSAQQTYDLQPADYAVRGIPLTVAGMHRIEITYTAPGFAAGLWITSLTLLMTGVAACVIRFRRVSQDQALAAKSTRRVTPLAPPN